MNVKKIDLPVSGVVFWPVGNGDSSSIVVDTNHIIQMDLRHPEGASEQDDPHTPMVDQLIEVLPTKDGKPYLSVFALSHADQDHCLGFEDLLDRVTIGEIWHTPRVFREYAKDLCDDAKAFRKEAKRRVSETVKNGAQTPAGDRVRIIGYDDLLNEDDYKGFPEEKLTIPGNSFDEIDGETLSDQFRAFVHAPFKDDSAGERNETSLALQITLKHDEQELRALLMGDLSYPTIRRMFDETDDSGDVAWNILLGPHHCSKSVMYWKGEDEEEESLKQDILDDLSSAAKDPGYVVVSSDPIPSSNKAGDNPPHFKAKSRYEEIAPDGFLCTQEHGSHDEPDPIVFDLGEADLLRGETEENEEGENKIAAAVSTARGTEEPPAKHVGFGER